MSTKSQHHIKRDSTNATRVLPHSKTCIRNSTDVQPEFNQISTATDEIQPKFYQIWSGLTKCYQKSTKLTMTLGKCVENSTNLKKHVQRPFNTFSTKFQPKCEPEPPISGQKGLHLLAPNSMYVHRTKLTWILARYLNTSDSNSA